MGYAWRKRGPSRRARENERLSRRIGRIHAASRGKYRAPPVNTELRARGVAVSPSRVARLTRARGRRGVSRRRPRCTTQTGREAQVAPDRVGRGFEAGRPNRLSVADITDALTEAGLLYLATVLDVFSCKVMGWAMGARQTAALAFTRRCEQAAVRQSMGATGNCFDKSIASRWVLSPQLRIAVNDGVADRWCCLVKDSQERGAAVVAVVTSLPLAAERERNMP